MDCNMEKEYEQAIKDCYDALQSLGEVLKQVDEDYKKANQILSEILIDLK